MASAVGSSVISNDRKSRLNNFDRVPSVQTPVRFGTGFGTSKSAWDSNGSIWSNGAHQGLFADESTDANLPNGSLPTATGDDQYSQDKTGSGSLFSSSESESWADRLTRPWNSVNTGASDTFSQPPGQTASPVRLRNGNGITNPVNLQARTRNGSAYLSANQASMLLPTKQAIHEPFRSMMGQPQTRPSTANAFGGLPDLSFTSEDQRGINAAVFRANNSIDSTQSRLPFPVSDSEASSLRRGTTHPNGVSTANRNEFETHDIYSLALKSYDQPQRHYNPLPRPLHRQSDPSNRSYSDVYDRALQYDGQEDQPPTAFSRMNAKFREMSTQEGPQFHPQRHSQRPVYTTDSSFETNNLRPTYQNVPQDSGLGATHGYGVAGMTDSNYQLASDTHRSMSFAEHEPISPAVSDYRRSLNSPLYSTSGTPPTGPESVRSASGSGFSSHTTNSLVSTFDRKPRGSIPYQSEQQYMTLNPLQARMQYGQQFDNSGYPGAQRLNPLANPYPMPVHHGMMSTTNFSRYPSRELDPGQFVRSAVLEDFRTNHKTNKRYELKDIYNHVTEFSGDQHGSRFIQQKLETANSDEKDQIFAEIQPNSLQLMTDVFGNYVIQKLFEHGSQAQKKILANQMKGHVLTLSRQMYGCRVVQKALEHVLTDQQASMVKELEMDFIKTVKDQNGNHVIQKAIERVPAEYVRFMIGEFEKQVQRLAQHPYGCRVIQRILEYCEEPAKQAILSELRVCIPTLIMDQFGNYVIQHIIENGDEKDKREIVSVVISQLLIFSKHKFASNVVEKSLEHAEASQRTQMIRLLTVSNEKGESPVLALIRDNFGNYVIQKVLRQLRGVERENLVNQIKPQLIHLKKFNYGKQILSIEKAIFDGETDPSISVSSQSSALPSTAPSTVEGPVTPPQTQISKPSFKIEPSAAGLSTSG